MKPALHRFDYDTRKKMITFVVRQYYILLYCTIVLISLGGCESPQPKDPRSRTAIPDTMTGMVNDMTSGPESMNDPEIDPDKQDESGTESFEDQGGHTSDIAGSEMQDPDSVAGAMISTTGGDFNGGMEQGYDLFSEGLQGIPSPNLTAINVQSTLFTLAFIVEGTLWVQVWSTDSLLLSLRVMEQLNAVDNVELFTLANRTILTLDFEDQPVQVLDVDQLIDQALNQSTEELLMLDIDRLTGILHINDYFYAIGSYDGRLAWQQISISTMSAGELQVTTQQITTPDAITEFNGQALLRYDHPPQCMTLDPEVGLTNTMACPSGTGRYLSNHQLPLLTYQVPEAQDTEVYVLPATASTNEDRYKIGTLLKINDSYPIWRTTNGTALYLTQLSNQDSVSQQLGILNFSETEGLWRSIQPWEGEVNTSFVGARVGQIAYIFTFSEDQEPTIHPLQLTPNIFAERNPYNLIDRSSDPLCPRANIERCDGIDNDCDGVIDDGICCLNIYGTMRVRIGMNGTPGQILLTDVASRDGLRVAIQTAPNHWDIWAFIYSYTSPRIEYEGSINQAGEALSFHSVGERYALVAKDTDEEWSIFWHHPELGAFAKSPEKLGCINPLVSSNLGASPTDRSLVILCDDRLIHARHDQLEDGSYPPIESYIERFEALPPLEWARVTRHNSNGLSTFTFAVQSSVDQTWEVLKLPVSQSSTGLQLQQPTPLTGRLQLDPTIRPDPLIIHKSDLPGGRSTPPVVMISDPQPGTNPLEVSLITDQLGPLSKQTFKYPYPLNQARYAPLSDRLIVSAPTSEDSVDFWVLDVHERPDLLLWPVIPTFSWERSPDDESNEPLKWDVVYGGYSNFFMLFYQISSGIWELRTHYTWSCEGQVP